MFHGLYDHTIDNKGRLSVPVQCRELLVGSAGRDPGAIIVTTGIDRCLVVYPTREWQALETRLATVSQFDPAVVQLKRIYVAGARACDVDGHGRLLVPPLLREYAALKREVVWAGMVNTLELWSKELWNEQVAVSRADKTGIAKALATLGI